MAGTTFEQMFFFVGLKYNDESMEIFALIVLATATLSALSLISILILQIRDKTLVLVNAMIESNPDRKDFWIGLKKFLEA